MDTVGVKLSKAGCGAGVNRVGVRFGVVVQFRQITAVLREFLSLNLCLII